MAGLAGALIAPLTNINPHMGHNVIITAFIVTIVGGIGSLPGAVIASVLYALFHTFVTTYISGTIATISGLPDHGFDTDRTSDRNHGAEDQ